MNLTSQNPFASFHYGYVIVGCCFLIMLVIVGLVMSCAGIFYKPVSKDLGVNVGQLGIYMSFNFLFSTLTLSFAGKVMEWLYFCWFLRYWVFCCVVIPKIRG